MWNLLRRFTDGRTARPLVERLEGDITEDARDFLLFGSAGKKREKVESIEPSWTIFYYFVSVITLSSVLTSTV